MLWQTIRGPLVVILLAGLGIATATVVDQATHAEWTLTLGAVSLGMVLPAGVIWLVAVLIGNSARRRSL